MKNTLDTDSIAKLAAHPSAAVLAADLPQVLGLPPDEVDALVEQLVGNGALLNWSDHPAGPCVILSTDAADALGLELIPVFRRASDAPVFRWLPPTCPAAKRAERKGRRGVAHLESDLRDRDGHGGFDALADENAPDPLADDLIDEKPRLPLRNAVPPRLFYGLSWQWPIAPTRDGSCRACGHVEHMPGYGYCLWCARSGSDSSLAEVSPDERPQPAVPALHDDGLCGGRGKAEPKRRTGKKSLVNTPVALPKDFSKSPGIRDLRLQVSKDDGTKSGCYLVYGPRNSGHGRMLPAIRGDAARGHPRDG